MIVDLSRHTEYEIATTTENSYYSISLHRKKSKTYSRINIYNKTIFIKTICTKNISCVIIAKTHRNVSSIHLTMIIDKDMLIS